MDSINFKKRELYCAEIDGLYRRAYRHFLKKGAPYHKVNGKTIIKSPDKCNQKIYDMIQSDKPFMVGRFGSTELSVMANYYHIKAGMKNHYLPSVIKTIQYNAGFFPAETELLDKYAELMIDACSNLDIVGLWNDVLEMYTVHKFAPKATGAMLYCLEPFYSLNSSWTHALRGKKVLVVHPFECSIQSQLKNKDQLFDKDFWPECDIRTFKAVQTIAGQKDERFSTWFEALEYMKSKIQTIDFDIAIIGCGAYGFPLAANIRANGKQAIHLGGATQLLFGIKGKRWENSSISKYFNEYWIYPSENERPKNATIVENACYW